MITTKDNVKVLSILEDLQEVLIKHNIVIKPDEYDVSDRYEPLAICDADDINNVFYNSSIDIKELDRVIKKMEVEECPI